MSSVIDTLIFDRTLEDVERVKTLAAKGYSNMTTAEKATWNAGMKGALNYSDANRLGNACNYIYTKLTTDYDITITAFGSPKVDWVASDIPTQSTFTNEIYSCMASFRNSDIPSFIKSKMGNVPRFLDNISYTILNATEKFLYDTNYYTECIATTNTGTVTYNKDQYQTNIKDILPSGSTQLVLKGCVSVDCTINDDNYTSVDLENANVRRITISSDNLTALKISPTSQITSLDCPALTTLYIYKDATISSAALNKCVNLTNITVESGNAYTFETGVVVDSDGKIIAIYGSNVTIPTDTTITTIGTLAMNYLQSTTLTIPNNILYVLGNGIANATNLEHVIIGTGLASIDSSAFLYSGNYSKILDFTVDTNNATYKSENNAMLNKAGTTLVFGGGNTTVVPSGVTTIGDSAFQNRGMTSTTLDVPTTVTSIGSLAFYTMRNKDGNAMTINYAGTMAQWEAITKGSYWVYRRTGYGYLETIHCTDGDITIS